MKLEHQVCTLEQADVIDKLGVRLTCHFAWLKEEGKDEFYLCDENTAILKAAQGTQFRYVSAYTCAELGVLLPSYDLLDYCCDYQKMGSRYRVDYENPSKSTHHKFISHYETHAKADLLIHLLKEKLVNPKDLTLED